MSAVENMRKRLLFEGGNQEGRMQKDKLTSLKRALLYSYQAATAEIFDRETINDTPDPKGKKFRCLMNPDKLKGDYDNKILSIPFEDICLDGPPEGPTTQHYQKIDLRQGDVFKWVETDTYWLIYLNHLEEDAYFRADLYRCNELIKINDHFYHIYCRGPVETTTQWLQKAKISWSKLNYSLRIFVTKTDETLEFFHRFQKLKVRGKTYEVVAVDSFSPDGIIEAYLDEYYENTIEEAELERQQALDNEKDTEATPRILGPTIVGPYESHLFSIDGDSDGEWYIDSPYVKVVGKNSTVIKLNFNTMKNHEVELVYKGKTVDTTLSIKIKSV